MKKLLLAVAAFLTITGSAMAQHAAPAPQIKTVQKATTTRSTTVAPAPVSVTTKSTIQTKHVTKSGALDKRYKENKVQVAAPVATPVKKDGTPDMRYKSNKKTTTIQQTTSN